MKHLIKVLILLLWSFPSLSQIISEDTFLRSIKTYNIDFHHEDSIIAYTLFVSNTGQFTFREGHNQTTGYILPPKFEKGKQLVIFRDTIIPAVSAPKRINSFYPTLLSDSTKEIWDSTQLVQNGKKWEYEKRDFIPPFKQHFFNELRYSYILGGAGLSDLYHSGEDSIIRIFLPNEIDDDLNDIYEVDLSSERLRIYYTSYSHDKNASFIIHARDSVLITKKREIRNLYKTLPSIDFSNNTYFEKFDYSTRYFIEFKTKENYYAFKREYIDERGNYPENSLPIVVYGLYHRNIKKKK